MNRIKVLIVDDQPLVLEILSNGLSKDPTIEIVGTATDGLLALNQIKRLNPDVIILDMEMPRMNGIQFLHTLMPDHPIPTIVLSALTEGDSKITDEAFNAGAVDFLKKPTGGAKGLSTLLIQLWTKIKIAATKDVSHYKKIQKSFTLPTNHLERTIKTNKTILGMGEMEISSDPNRELKIFALGSCIGLALFCPLKNMVGLAHVALPQSKTDPDKAENLPGYFADTAVPTLFDKMVSAGCPSNKIYAKIAGGCKTKVELGNYFEIGSRNVIAVKASLMKLGLKILGEEVGGDISRTVSLKAGDKMLKLSFPDKGSWEI